VRETMDNVVKHLKEKNLSLPPKPKIFLKKEERIKKKQMKEEEKGKEKKSRKRRERKKEKKSTTRAFDLIMCLFDMMI
jgi:hypothetical protein